MSDAPFDARAVANLLLDIAERKGRPASNLELQKLLYFAHGRFLIACRRPLVTGYFEAWQHGPVHPAVYRAFKGAGARPIGFRAEKVDLVTGECSVIPAPDSQEVREHLDFVMFFYARLTARQLVEISHAPLGPWDLTVAKARRSVRLGMRIPDDVIVSNFARHKIVIGADSSSGELAVEDTPFT